MAGCESWLELDECKGKPDAQEKNMLYLIEIETFVSKTLRPFTTDKVEDYW